MRYTIRATDNEKFLIIDNETGKPYGDPLGTLAEAAGAQRIAEGMAMQDRIAVCQRGQCSI
ncbi:hypothetical protein FG152_24675 [Ochrobactrum sp. XJ1]|nr:hypothetical protein [Ochrobactrum sp. XJ1]